MEKKSFIRRIPGFRSGKWWKMILASISYFFIFIIIIGALFGPTSDIQSSTHQTQSPQDQIIAKSTTEMLPTRSDFSTEWILGDIQNLTINFTGFESNSQREIRIGAFSDRNVITISVYKFSSTNASNDYYNSKIARDNYLQKGGYKKVDMKIGAKCEAYKVDRITAETGQAYCVSSNIFFELKVVSETFEAEKYLKDIGKIIDQKIS